MSEMAIFPRFRTSREFGRSALEVRYRRANCGVADRGPHQPGAGPLSGGDFLSRSLDCDCGGFPAADAERGDAPPEFVGLERMEQRHDQPRAGGADRMSKRAGAAVDVQLVAGDTK